MVAHPQGRHMPGELAHGHDHGHGHNHDHSAPPATSRVRWLLGLTLAPLVLGTLVGIVALWPSSQDARPRVDSPPRVAGTVLAVDGPPCPVGQPDSPPCPAATVRLTAGDRAGAVVTASVPEGAHAPTLRPGDRVVLLVAPGAPADLQYEVVDFQRGAPLALLAAAFAVAVVALGRLRGIAALAGLAVTFAVLLLFVLPAILAGSSPLPVAIVGSAAIMLVALYLTHGVSARTTVAVIGTLASLVLTGLLAAAAIRASQFTGLGTEEAATLGAFVADVDLRGLLLAGVIIGSLGVLDDVTVTQASAVWELRRADPSRGARGLYQAGMRIGRAHVASTVNTLVLAYAGASLPLLLLFSASPLPITTVLTSEFVAQEVVRSLAGALGLIAAVPVTTALAALVAIEDRPRGRAGRRNRGSRASHATQASRTSHAGRASHAGHARIARRAPGS
jgi:uncharacterized membrane protein